MWLKDIFLISAINYESVYHAKYLGTQYTF